MQSLKQLIRAKWKSDVFIIDWPRFPDRIIFDDISRGPVSTVDYIKEQIERLAEIKVNGLSFYIEHVVQPYSHPDFAPHNGKLSIPQIKELTAFAKKYHINLIGSFQSFGHFEKILALPQYASMGETPNLISPLDPKAKRFLENVIGELCGAFGSEYFNVNCDETFDLTKGRSKHYIDSVSPAKFYADHIQFLYDIVKRHGKKLMMWGDVAIEYPAITEMLPKDIIYLTWEYGDKNNFDHWILPFKDPGLNYMVCPGILNSYRMFPDMKMAKANIRGFVNDGARHNAKGVYTTIWDDGGMHLFSGDWYGVYFAAEKSWNVNNVPEESFDRRYEFTAYQTSNGAYVNALNKLMELSSLPITYNLNDQVWRQKLLPDSGQKLIVNNETAGEALKILNTANLLLKDAKPNRFHSDINALQFSIDQYKLIIDSRIELARIADTYKSLSEENRHKKDLNKSLVYLREAQNNAGQLATRYRLLKQSFSQAWLRENQPYWLDVVQETYNKKIADLNSLSRALQIAANNFKNRAPLPASSTIRLAITSSTNYYFQNWLLAGPIPLQQKNRLPDFLYSENKEYNRPPIPGDITYYNRKQYRWQKFSSEDGGFINLNSHYTAAADNSVVYAYCNLTSDKQIDIKAFFDGAIGSEIYCNGEIAFRNDGKLSKEANFILPLKAGVNHLLFKLPKPGSNGWAFTFGLDPNATVTTHKHKYQLNPKKINYEAE